MINPGFVYILRFPLQHDLYKIGMTTNLSRRMKELSYLGPDLVFSVGTNDPRGLERRVQWEHRQYWKFREWFQFPDDVLAELVNSLSGEERL